MDPAVLLQSKGDDSPSGENLEYDPAFTEMELAAQPGEERQIGDEITAAEDPEYGVVAKQALIILEKSHDLRAAMFLGEALLVSEGIPGFADVSTYVRGCLEDFWATCHPELDEDDDNDPTMRINAVQALCGQPDGLAGPSPIYRLLRRAPLTESRSFGRISVRDIEIAEGHIQATAADGVIPDTGAISAAFRDTDDDTLTQIREAVETATENVRAIGKVFDEQTPGQGPELDPLIKLLMKISKRLAHYAGSDDAVEDTDDGPQDAGHPAEAGAARSAPVGGINSPNDVSNALDRIIAYYARAEPSSPIPLLLTRAKRLVNADFLTIIQDMAPAGTGNVHLIGGIDDDD